MTEEVWGFVPGAAERGPLVVARFPQVDDSLVDDGAEEETGRSIELTRRVRRWRDLVGVAPGVVLPARLAGGPEPHEFVARLARLSLDSASGEAVTTIGPVEILGSEEVDPADVRRRIDERLEELQAEVARAEGKLANDGFVKRAPEEVVAAEREKLERYRAELWELGGLGG